MACALAAQCNGGNICSAWWKSHLHTFEDRGTYVFNCTEITPTPSAVVASYVGTAL